MVGKCGVVELVVVVFGAVKELSIRGMHLMVVLRELDIKVGDPAEFAVDVAILAQLCIVRHPRALHFIFFVRVQLSLRADEHSLLVFEFFVEVLLQMESEIKITHLPCSSCDCSC